MIGIGSSFATPANAASQAMWMHAAKLMGFGMVRIDPGFAEFAPTTSTTNSTGVVAAAAQAALRGLGMVVVLTPTPANHASYITACGGTIYISRRPGRGASNAGWDAIIVQLQAMIDAIWTAYLANGGDPAKLIFQWANEPGWGGSGGPQTGGFGTMDAGVRADIVAHANEGIWDTDADWDALASASGKPNYGNVPGFLEMSQYMVPRLNFRGPVLAPAIENQLFVAAYNCTGPDSQRIGSTITLPYEMSTCGAVMALCDILDFHVYAGDTSADSTMSPKAFAAVNLAIIEDRVRQIRATSWGKTKPIWVTECGLARGWARAGSGEVEIGQYWLELRNMLNSAPIERGFLYRLANYSASDDSSAGSSFGMMESTGNSSAGMKAILALTTPGAELDASPRWGGSWLTSSSVSEA